MVKALEETEANNLQLKAKSYEIELAKESLKEPDAYKKGTLTFNETISRTNNAGYVFGMKMASREASFGDFGFSEFLGGVAGVTGMASQMASMSGADSMAVFFHKCSVIQGYKQRCFQQNQKT